MKKLLAIVLLLLGIQACANNTENNAVKEHNKAQKETAMRETEIFGREPIYKLRINAYKAGIVARLNGVEVYKNFSESGRNTNLITVNDLIVNGFNSIDFTLSSEQKLSSKAKGEVTLEVFAEGKHYILNHLSVDMSQKEITKDSTPPGRYSYTKEGFKADSNGTIVVEEVKMSPDTMYQSTKQDGIKVTQRISLPTPFPRWRFLDSQDIIDFDINYISMDEYNKLKHSPKIQALYALDAKLRAALKAKNPQSIIDLFSERFQESAAAFYDTAQNLKKELLDDFIEVVHNPTKKLIEYPNPDDLYFVIEENRKLAWIRPIEFYDKETGIYSSYEIKYRINKQGEWVITR